MIHNIKEVRHMKIIDAHIHFYKDPNGYFDKIAKTAGHENSEKYLKEYFRSHDIVKGIAVGNVGTDPKDNVYPSFLSYAVGINKMDGTEMSKKEILGQIEDNLKRKSCVGIKLYPGYTHEYIFEKHYYPIYELAAAYGKTVAVHTGITASDDALLKYCHPLVLDEVAVAFPNVKLVMCHIGYPWLADAIAVLEKNENVFADISGILVGNEKTIPKIEKDDCTEFLRRWLSMLGMYDKIMYGTDWPLVNIEMYIDFVKKVIPKNRWEDVFFNNANRIYGLGL